MDMVDPRIKRIKDYAKENNVPIMQDDGINYLTNFIIKNDIKTIPEIGTAIGYSAIQMALVNNKIKIVSVERDEKRYLEALKNIKEFKLEDRISLVFCDALELKLDAKFDLIFLDAAKSQNIKFFNNFSKNLEDNGYIITDNMHFHGYVSKNLSEIKSRNLRGLIRKIKEYREFLENNNFYNTQFIDIGDGLAVTNKKCY